MSKAIKRSAVLITVIAAFAAISAPMAQARLDLNPPTASSSQAPAEQPAALVVAEGTGSSSGGFDWGDAAIGAGAMLVLTGLATGAVLVTRGRRQAAPAEST